MSADMEVTPGRTYEDEFGQIFKVQTAPNDSAEFKCDVVAKCVHNYKLMYGPRIWEGSIEQFREFYTPCEAPSPAHTDMVNHPPHYTQGKYETIDVIEDWQLEYHEGNAVKYISRAQHKGTRTQDLKKAVWYLNRKIERLEKSDG